MAAWARNDAAPIGPLVADLEVDCCVVGLGGSGLAAVHTLLDMGQRVAAIDAIGVAPGAAGRNGGFLLAGTAGFHHDAVAALGRVRATSLYRQTLAELDAFEADAPDVVIRRGSLRIAGDEAEVADCTRQFDAMSRDELPVERYVGPEGEGLLFPFDGVFNPGLRCDILAARAIERGALLHAPAHADAIHPCVVHSGEHRIHCRHVFVLVDGGLARVLPELSGVVRTARLQMVATAPIGRRIWDRPVYYRHGYEYWQQLEDTTLLVGGFRDRAGESEWTENAEPDEAVQTRLDTFVRDRLGVTEPITHRWAASVGFTKGVLPYVGEVRPGVWAAGGYNGTGNVIGAICGRGLAELAVTGDPRTLRDLRG
ncbi:MAG: FAD-binding oxidoreductase [Gemmatimonadales bacterium]